MKLPSVKNLRHFCAVLGLHQNQKTHVSPEEKLLSLEFFYNEIHLYLGKVYTFLYINV